MPSLVTIGSGVFEGAGANFPPFPLIPLTFAVVLNTECDLTGATLSGLEVAMHSQLPHFLVTAIVVVVTVVAIVYSRRCVNVCFQHWKEDTTA